MTDKQSDSAGVQFDVCTPASNIADVRTRHQANRAAWNEAAREYTAELEQTLAFLKAGESNLHPLERRNLGNLRDWCDTAVHLQCASGRDTLSLWIEGVKRVIGVDISDEHIANAQRLSDALHAPATWYRCDIIDIPAELHGTADLVYTGRGALCWLQEIEQWSAMIAKLLKPGGIFHILDDHPANILFDPESSELRCSGLAYFDYCEHSRGWSQSYLPNMSAPPEEQSIKYERNWTLAEIVNAVIGAGLVVEHLGEYSDEYWDKFPNLPAKTKRCLPMTFTLKARKPKGQ